MTSSEEQFYLSIKWKSQLREENIWRLSWLKVVSFLTHHTQYTSSFTNCTVYTHHAHPVSRYSSICAVIPKECISIVAKLIFIVLVFIHLFNHIHHHLLQWPVLVALIAVAIEDKDGQPGVLLQVLLVQAKPLVRVPAKNPNVFGFLPTIYNCSTKLTLSRPSPWSPHCTNSAFALSDTWYRFMTDV